MSFDNWAAAIFRTHVGDDEESKVKANALSSTQRPHAFDRLTRVLFQVGPDSTRATMRGLSRALPQVEESK